MLSTGATIKIENLEVYYGTINGWEEIESITGNNDHNDYDYDDRVHYVTNENVLNVLEITKEIKHPRTPSPNFQNISVPTILNCVDVPPDLVSAPLKYDPPTGCRPPDKPEKGSDEFRKKVSKKSLKIATMLLAALPDVENS